MPITGTPISSDFVSTSFDADGNRNPILDVALLHNRDSGGRIANDLLNAAAHHDGVGAPTTAPTRAGQLSVDNEGNLYVSGDEIVNVAIHPTITTHQVGPGQGEWAMWRGAGIDGSLTANGYFQWNLNTHGLRQRRGSVRSSRTWEEIVQYIEDNSLGFPTGISAATVYLGKFTTEDAAALAASRLSGFDLNTGTYVFIHEEHAQGSGSTNFHLKRVLTYTAGNTTPTEVLFWRDAPLTRREIVDLAVEESARHRPVDKPKQVSRIPATEDEPVLNLTHDEYEASATADHQTVTLGEAAGLYGYSDGQALQQAFGSVTGESPLAFILGEGVGAGNTITSFTPNILGSPNRGFVEDISTIVIDGTDYALGVLDYRYSAFRRPITSGPRITTGSFTYNFKDADGNLYFTDSTTVANEAGLYWWNPDLATPAYELMRAGVDARKQVHVLLASNYQLSNRRIAANLPTGETEELGDIHTFLVPSIIGSETSGTAVTLYVGIGAAHTIIKPNGDDVYPADLEAGTRYWVQAIATSYVLIEEPGTAGTLFGRGEPPEATAARVGLQYLDLTSKVLYGCFDDPHRTSESTGDFDDINRSDIEINLNDRLEDITVVENEWLYRVASNRFYAGTDVGASQLAWVDDTADDALAASLVTNTDEVVWLGRHIDNEEALRGLTAIETGKEYFFYREQDGDIVRLDNSSFSAAGSTVAHPFWFPVKADDREEHVFDARDGLPTLANDGSDDNRIGVTNTGVYIVDVDPISATDPTADSWADYAATDYEGAFAADPTIDTGHWYANYVRRTFREFESTNFGLGWIPHDAPTGFIGWYQSRQDALNHAAERGVANSGNFVAYTGSGTVETATNFTAATSARIQRNWIFVPVGAGDDTKADTDLQNIDTDLTDSQQSTIRTRIGAVGAGDTVTTAPILDLPANAITVETGTLYHGDGIYSIYVYTPTSDFPLTAETRPETGADWQTMWAPVVAGVKEVTAYPAPSAVHDRDVRKIFFRRDTNDLPADIRHLKSVDPAEFVLTTGSTSSSHGRRYGYERDQYGALTGFLNISKLDELPLGANAYRLEMHVDATGTIPRANTIRTAYLRKRGASHWRVYHMQNGSLGEYTSPNYNNRRLEEGAVYDVIVISNSQGSDGQEVENVHEEDRYAAFPGGRNWARFAELDDFDSVQVIVEHLVAMSNIPDATNDTRVLLSKSGIYVLEAPATVRSDIGLGDSNDRIPAARLPGKVVHEATSDYHTGGIVQLDPSPDNPVGSGDLVTFFAPSNLALDSTNLSARIGLGSESDMRDRDGTRLQANDLTRGTLYTVLNDSTGWIIETLPAGSGASLSSSTPSEHGIGQSASAGTSSEASRSDHVHAIPVGVPVATGTANAEGTATTASRSDHVHESSGVFSWGFVIDTLIVPELNQDAISTARIVLEDSGLTHYLAFLDWTAANLDMISHLPVGAHIGLRQGSTTRILEVTAEWDSTNERYQVININAEGLLEEASGTATELLLTAGVSGSGGGSDPEELATNITYTFPGSAGAAGAIFTIGRALVEADDYRLVVFSQRIGVNETTGREPITPVLARDIRQLGRTVYPGEGNQIAVTTSVIRLIGPWDLDYHDSPSTTMWNLHYSGSLVTTLASSATVGSTTLSLTDVGDLEAGNTIFIDSETIVITSVSGNDLTVPATTAVHASGASVHIDDKRGFFFGQTRNLQSDVDDLDIILLGGGGIASAGGQQSPGTAGVAELTPNLVRVTFWKWVLTTDGKPANPTAHWRFDDEWDGTTPFTGGGWYISRATALDEADNNPAFSQDTWTLWTATEQVRRRVVNDAYSYTDGGYTVTAAWDIQYSTDDGSTWTTTEPTDLYHYIRYRDQETGEWGPIIPVGTSVGSNDWQPIRTNDLVYPGNANQDELGAVYDFGDFSELLFLVAGYRLITVPDGMGGTMTQGVNGPWHQCVVSRGGGWPVADASDGQDNNDADDGACFQFTYFATNTGVGLLVWERGDLVNLGNPPLLQSSGEPPIQMGGHFKIVSTDGDEAHVTKFRFFAFSHSFARTTMSIFARYR